MFKRKLLVFLLLGLFLHSTNTWAMDQENDAGRPNPCTRFYNWFKKPTVKQPISSEEIAPPSYVSTSSKVIRKNISPKVSMAKGTFKIAFYLSAILSPVNAFDTVCDNSLNACSLDSHISLQDPFQSPIAFHCGVHFAGMGDKELCRRVEKVLASLPTPISFSNSSSTIFLQDDKNFRYSILPYNASFLGIPHPGPAKSQILVSYTGVAGLLPLGNTFTLKELAHDGDPLDFGIFGPEERYWQYLFNNFSLPPEWTIKNIPANNNTVGLPLGFLCETGLLPPTSAPMETNQPKSFYFNQLPQELQKKLFPKGYKNTSFLVTMYVAPDKYVDPKILEAIAKSKYMRDKDLTFLLKGDEKQLKEITKALKKTKSHIAQIKEFLKNDVWNPIASGLSDISIVTGDTGYFDAFLRKGPEPHLAIMNGHKAFELRALAEVAKELNASPIIIEFLELIRDIAHTNTEFRKMGEDIIMRHKNNKCFSLSEQEMLQFELLKKKKEELDKKYPTFIEMHLDEKFMAEWQELREKIANKHTFTPEKFQAIMHVVEAIFSNDGKRVTDAFESVSQILPLRTQACLAFNYYMNNPNAPRNPDYVEEIKRFFALYPEYDPLFPDFFPKERYRSRR